MKWSLCRWRLEVDLQGRFYAYHACCYILRARLLHPKKLSIRCFGPHPWLFLQLRSEDMPEKMDDGLDSMTSNGSSIDGDVSRLTTEQKHEMRDYLAAEAAKLQAEAEQGEASSAAVLPHTWWIQRCATL